MAWGGISGACGLSRGVALAFDGQFPGAYRVLVKLSLEMQYRYYLFIITVSLTVRRLPTLRRI
jgi:hypothetical protein